MDLIHMAQAWDKWLALVNSQSQSYYGIGGLPPIISSWRQALENHDQRFFFN
jgi:hypothetical protein